MVGRLRWANGSVPGSASYLILRQKKESLRPRFGEGNPLITVSPLLQLLGQCIHQRDRFSSEGLAPGYL